MGANPACNVDPLGLQFQPLQSMPQGGGIPNAGVAFIDGSWEVFGAWAMSRGSYGNLDDVLNESANANAQQAIAKFYADAKGKSGDSNGSTGSTNTKGTSTGKDGENAAKDGGESKKLFGTVGTKPFPIQKQPGENYCVYTCLSAIAEFYHRTLSPEDAEKKAEELFLGGDLGIPSENIPILATALGFEISLIQNNGNPNENEEIVRVALANGSKVLMISNFSPSGESPNHATVNFYMETWISSSLKATRKTFMADPGYGTSNITLTNNFFKTHYLVMFSVTYPNLSTVK